jgi:hypothetical protein
MMTYSDIASAAGQCKRGKGENIRMFQFPTHYVAVIGWSHAGLRDYARFSEALSKLRNPADCAGIEKALSIPFDANPNLLPQQEYVFGALEAIEKKGPIAFIGEEADQEDIESRKKADLQTEKFAKELAKKCGGGNVTSLLQSLRASFLGVGNVYAKLHNSEIIIEGSEDQIARAPGERALEIKQSNIIRPEEFTEQGVKMIQDIINVPVSSTYIDQIAQHAKTKDAATRLRNYLEANNTIILGLEKRNDSIIARAMSRKKNYVVIVGSAHLSDISYRIGKACDAS